ncbi:hypothetical protein IWQ62_003382 [Dispira parvispora]|uniref:Uncharacterized protein n=1 Tax=Dispira parvispora TaxID=1520584 RepID=A0A9W8AN07_9FUNG|nr:hypothetical protein IWQ62_003382 [Dispira parvispora]
MWRRIRKAIIKQNPSQVWQQYVEISKLERFYLLDNYRYDKLLTFFRTLYQKAPVEGDIPSTTTQPLSSNSGSPLIEVDPLPETWSRSMLRTATVLLCEDWFGAGMARAGVTEKGGKGEPTRHHLSRMHHAAYPALLGTWCFRSMTTTLCQVDSPQSAYNILVEMVRVGDCPQPEAVYPLMKYYYRQRDTASLQHLLTQVDNWGVAVNAATLAFRLRMALADGQTDQVWRLLRQAEHTTDQQLAKVFTKCIKPLLTRGEPDMLRFIQERILVNFDDLSPSDLKIYLNALFTAGLTEEARQLFVRAVAQSTLATPQLTCYWLRQAATRGLASLKAFHHSIEQSTLVTSPQVLSQLCCEYGKLGEIQWVEKLTREFLETTQVRSTLSFNRVLQGLLATSQPELILKVYQSMAKCNCFPDHTTLDLVKGQSLPAEVTQAWDWVMTPKGKQEVVSSVEKTAGAMRYLVACRHFDQVLKIYRATKFTPSPSNMVHLGSIVQSLAEAGQGNESLALLRRLTGSRKVSFYPSPIMFSVLMKCCLALSHQKYFDFLLQLYHSDQLQLNVFGYTNILQGLARFGRYDQIQSWIDRMQRRRVTPNQSTLTTLIIELCEQGQPSLAEEYAQLAPRYHCTLPVEVYNKFVHTYAQLGDEAKVAEVFTRMKAAAVAPTSATYTGHVTALVSKGLYAKAWSQYQEYVQLSIPLDVRIYEPLLYALVQLNDSVQADALFRKAVQDGFQPEALCLNLLITQANRNLLRLNIADYEAQFQRQLTSSDPRIIAAWNALFYYFVIWRDETRAKAYWDLLKKRALVPDHVTLSLLLDACRVFDWPTRLAEIRQLAQRYRLAFDTNNYTSLIEYHCAKGQPAQALTVLVETMPLHQVVPDEKLVHNLVQMLLSHGYEESLVQLRNFVRKQGPPLTTWFQNVNDDDDWRKFCES